MVSKLSELMGYRYTHIGIASTSLLGRYQLLKYLLRGPYLGAQMIRVGLDTSVCARKGWVNQMLLKVGEDTYATGHVPYSDLFMSLLSNHGIRVVVVIRDPRDVIVSNSHHVADLKWHYAHEKYVQSAFSDRIRFTLYGGISCVC